MLFKRVIVSIILWSAPEVAPFAVCPAVFFVTHNDGISALNAAVRGCRQPTHSLLPSEEIGDDQKWLPLEIGGFL